MPYYHEKGIVLRSKTLRDADRHYTLFTEGRGKLVLLAKGSRRGKSKMAPHMASFGTVKVMAAQGKYIDRLAGAALDTHHPSIIASLQKTALAQSFFLATDALTKNALPEPRVYALLTEYLRVLDREGETGERIRDLVFDAAVIKLLDILGFGLELKTCVQCRKPLIPQGNALNMLRGGIECRVCRDSTSVAVRDEVIKVLRFFRGESLIAVRILRIDAQTIREVMFITDLLLATHLEERFTALKYLRAVT